MRRWLVIVTVVALVGGAAAVLLMPGGLGLAEPTMRGSGDSMSHGERQAGVLDDGDLGNYQPNPAFEDITTMVAARAAGAPQVAGDWGDVLVFRPDGVAREEPGKRVLVEHRALVWVAYDPATGRFDVPELGLAGVREVTIPDVGAWDSAAGAYLRRDLTLTLVADDGTYPAGRHSGWVTKGDHNLALDQAPGAGGAVLSQLVQPAWVEGRLLRVVDQEQVMLDAFAGVGAALLAGGLAIGGWMWLKRTGGLPSMAGLAPWRAASCACGATWGTLSFCARCGAERAPRTRYATPEALEAARAVARRR